MKLLQTQYGVNFTNTIESWASVFRTGKATLFHIYAPYNRKNIRKELDEIRSVLHHYAPDTPIIGCSATGEILDGHMMDNDTVVTLMVFEDATTKVEVLPYYDRLPEINPEKLLEYTKAIPDLKGIELMTSAAYQQLDDTRMIMDKLPENIEVFGGVAVGDAENPAFIFANDCKCCECGSAIVLFSGPELHLRTDRMFGWKPIGYPLKVTRSKGPVVYELDGRPAYDVYNHYLHIKKDSHFFYNALEFPWEVRVDEETAYIRHAKSVNPDGSIVMSSDIPEGSNVRLTYGDPRRIIDHTRQTGVVIRDFAPQIVSIINCMGRKLFWGGEERVEVAELSRHMQTTGYSALGEIQRYKGLTLLNNLSIVTVAMREGPATEEISLDMNHMEEPGSMSITARLAIFINTITDELMEKNLQLNEMLYKASHDALTGLYNRGAIERIIYESAETDGVRNDSEWFLIMFDVDDFKQINDRRGHVEGDNILRMIARSLSDYAANLPGVSVGRWGGEEFMIFVQGYEPMQVVNLANDISNQIKKDSATQCPVTISTGVTAHCPDEDVLQTITRVDELMYSAKNSGKDQVCSDIT